MNLERTVLETGMLPLHYVPIKLVEVIGFEPINAKVSGLQPPELTILLKTSNKIKKVVGS